MDEELERKKVEEAFYVHWKPRRAGLIWSRTCTMSVITVKGRRRTEYIHVQNDIEKRLRKHRSPGTIVSLAQSSCTTPC